MSYYKFIPNNPEQMKEHRGAYEHLVHVLTQEMFEEPGGVSPQFGYEVYLGVDQFERWEHEPSVYFHYDPAGHKSYLWGTLQDPVILGFIYDDEPCGFGTQRFGLANGGRLWFEEV